MKTIFKLIMISTFPIIGLVSCETNDDYNSTLDMSSPKVLVKNDSSSVKRGNKIHLTAVLTDDAGVKSYSLEYTDWGMPAVVVTLPSPVKSYTLDTIITVPDDALYAWEGSIRMNYGTYYNNIELYHAVKLEVKDINLNVKDSYIYVRVTGDTIAPTLSDLSYKVYESDKTTLTSSGTGSFIAKAGQYVVLSMTFTDESILSYVALNSTLKNDTVNLLAKNLNTYVTTDSYSVSFDVPSDVSTSTVYDLKFVSSDYFDNKSTAKYTLTVNN
jgi:hypothetical protein